MNKLMDGQFYNFIFNVLIVTISNISSIINIINMKVLKDIKYFIEKSKVDNRSIASNNKILKIIDFNKKYKKL